MNYKSVNITLETPSNEINEILIALLGEYPFDTFEENETGIKAFIPENEFGGTVKRKVNALSKKFIFSYEVEHIAYKNWNEEWEKNYDPIKVENFVGIRADFHPSFKNVEHELIINPKMAFGTGHHSTTYMVMKMMRDIDFLNKKVLDYGCGTGILAILAERLGATEIFAIDIEPASHENTLVNCERNNTPVVEVACGTLDDVPDKLFDIILANINRNIILQSLPDLKKRLIKNGLLVVSGILNIDEDIITSEAEKFGFKKCKIEQRQNWSAIEFQC